MESFWPKTLGPNHHTTVNGNFVLYGWPVWASHSIWMPPGEFEAQVERDQRAERDWADYMTRNARFQVAGRQRPAKTPLR